MAGIVGFGKAEIGLGVRLKETQEAWGAGIRSIIGSYTSTVRNSVMTGAYIGIDYNKVSSMRDAIKSYVKSIQDRLDDLNTEANAAVAFKGEIQAAAKEFVVAVSDAAKIYTSQLLEFSDALQQAALDYQAHEADLSSQVRSQATNLTNGLSEYKPQ